MPHTCHRFWNCYKTLRFWSLLTRCTIPCVCHAKRRLNVQKSSEHVVLLTFWLGHVLRTTTAYTFSTAQFLKALRSWAALYILTSKNVLCATTRCKFYQFFISHLARSLRTRRFSEPTFRPSGATNPWKTQWIATFLPFRASASSFPWLFLTSAFPSVHILGSLTSKLSPNLWLILLIIANKHSKPPETNIDQHRNNDICNNVHLSFPVWLNPIEGHPLALSQIYPLVDVGDKSIRTLSKIESTLT